MNITNQEPAIAEHIATTFSKAETDREFRRQLRAFDPTALAQIGFYLNPDDDTSPKVKVMTSTQDTTYIQMPYRELSDGPITISELNRLQGGTASLTSIYPGHYI